MLPVQDHLCTRRLPWIRVAAEFLMMFSEVTDILYLYILDQNFDIYCSCTFRSFLFWVAVSQKRPRGVQSIPINY